MDARQDLLDDAGVDVTVRYVPALRNVGRADASRLESAEEARVDAWDSELILARLSWGARPESAEQIGRRLRETLALLRQLVPGRPEPVAYPDDLTDAARWTTLVGEHVVRGDDGRPEPESGFSPVVELRTAHDGSVVLAVRPKAGGRIESTALPSNTVLIRFGTQSGPNPALPASSNLRPAAADVVRGLVSIWQPDVAVLTGRSANKAQLKLGSRRGPTIGAVTWLARSGYAVPDSVAGAVVAPYGEGTLLIVDEGGQPSVSAAEALAVRAELDRAEVLVAAPVVQESPPQVPALDLLDPDAAAAQPEQPPVDADDVLPRVRGLQVDLPPALAGPADQPGWPAVVADLRESFDRLVAQPPFVNQLVDLDRGAASLRDNLVTELYREVSHPLREATAGRYLQLYRGLLAVEGGTASADLNQVSPFTPMGEAGSTGDEARMRVDETVATLVWHEVQGRFT